MSLVRSLRVVLFVVVAGSLAGACTSRAAVRHAGAPIAQPIAGPVARPAAAPIDRARVKAALADRRDVTFQRFLAYREARVYPVNPGPGTRHLWIDAQGNLCAAATMISGDWGRDATVAAAAGDLGIALADVRDGRLADWMLTSGLTHGELVAIQVPGSAVLRRPREPDARAMEIARLYQIYVDVERQLAGLWEENLDHAVDALMARPELARAFVEDPGGVVTSLSPFSRTFEAAPTVAYGGR
jgi:hypothetical protein